MPEKEDCAKHCRKSTCHWCPNSPAYVSMLIGTIKHLAEISRSGIRLEPYYTKKIETARNLLRTMGYSEEYVRGIC